MSSLSLPSLPVELLYEIQSFALSSSLPLTSRHLYAVFKSAPLSIHASYLIGRYINSETASFRSGLISVVLRYPLCTQDVLEAIFRSPECPPQRFRTPTELPRRLFRALAPKKSQLRKRKREEGDEGWSPDDEPLPFLHYLYDHPRIPHLYANSFDGYALTKAVHAGFLPLVRFLLEHDASPACKDGLAVMVAIRRKDLGLVRMLVERDDRQLQKKARTASVAPEGTQGVAGQTASVPNGNESEAKQEGFKSSKRRRLEDRVRVNQAMLRTAVKCDAREIVEYLVKEKGCVPDMKTVLMINSHE
ncbi:hypothetical protein POSPLDRAFT_134824 [Postia placenta Mad-698-R]|uniref:Uncharacterized protein n=1 Tax=Postia placenta MAD-698-R-SB12 TaxID=670580 RepID=A0A1X6MQR8_9APHY|nr:hypothetical protein POSPLADRAFT_1151720 [Postia placenta MAD-698-R-SB12]EED84277.1 hypothetical protein POSPLDRAFT_134824 [Postia placenta Mad-698-R]OSX58728.1 hypothetical protein POSPLADRAFT_1151720 [Postia placenta MAD-698-R-SB12]